MHDCYVTFSFFPIFIVGCQGSGPQLYNNRTYVYDGIEYVTGILIECDRGLVVAICNDGTIYAGLALARLYCVQMGYESMLYNFVSYYFLFLQTVHL